jgi:hypothetical protein
LINEYTAKTAVPILKEVIVVQNGWDYSYVTVDLAEKHPELSNAIKKLLATKETRLEQGMLAGKLPTAAAIFSLKQLDWRDSQNIKIDTPPVTLVFKDDYGE